MMKLFVLALFALIAVAAAADEKYTTKYDGINLDEILSSDRLFANYYKCLGGGKCTPDGRELKRLLPDALKTECAKCSEAQKAGTDKVIRFLIEKKPKEWKELAEKYDPEGIYAAKYKTEAEARGITI